MNRGAQLERFSNKALKTLSCQSFKVNLSTLSLLLMVLVYSIIFSILSIDIHNRFGTSGFDLGIQDQGIWLLSQGETPFSTVRGLHIFGDHVTFIHILIAPLYWLWDDVRAILVLQSVLLAVGAIPIYLLARDRFKNDWIPLIFSLSYLLYPALQYMNLWQFHPDSLAVPFLLFAFYFVTKRRYKPYFLFVFLTLLCKEEISLTVFAMGVYVALKYDRRIGAVTALASVIWLLLVFKVFLPYFNDFGYFRGTYGYSVFGQLGSTPVEAIKTVIFHPTKMFSILITQTNEKYLFDLMAPVGFLSLLNPLTLAISLPAFLSNTISGYHYTHFIKYHYAAAIIPFVFISTVEGISRLKDKKPVLITALCILLAASIFSNIYIGPEKSSIKNYNQIIETVKSYNDIRYEYESNVLQALILIPPEASVSTTSFFVPQLTHREKIYVFPNPFETSYWGVHEENPPPKDVEYVLVNKDAIYKEQKMIVTSLLEEKLYIKLYERGNIILIKKVYDGPLDEKYGLVRIRIEPFIKEVAITKRDYTICDKIESVDIKEECFKEVGIATNDFNLCDVRIKDTRRRDECFKGIGVAAKDFNLCDVRIESQELKDECLKEFAIAGKDYTICDRLEESSAIKDECFRGVAIATGDFNLCDVKIKDVRLRDECFKEVGIATNDFNLCDVRMKDQKLRDECFKEIGIATGDSNLCNVKIVDQKLRDECIEGI